MNPLAIYVLFTIVFQLVPTAMLYSIDRNFFYSILELREPTLVVWAFAMQMLATFATAFLSHSDAKEANNLLRKRVLSGRMGAPLLRLAKRGWVSIAPFYSVECKAWDALGSVILCTFIALSVRYVTSSIFGRVDLFRFPTLMFASWLGFIAYPYRWIPVGDGTTRLALAVAATFAMLFASAYLGDQASKLTFVRFYAKRLMKKTDSRNPEFRLLGPPAETVEEYLAYLEGGGDLNLLLRDIEYCVSYNAWGRALMIAEAVDRFLKEMDALMHPERYWKRREQARRGKQRMEQEPPKRAPSRTPMDDYVR